MRKFFVLLLSLTLFVMTAGPAAAGDATRRLAPERARLVIVADVFVDGSAGVFEASGRAVRSGMVCPAGGMTGEVVPPPDNWDVDVTYTFICDDDTGTFSLRLLARLLDAGKIGSFFVWSVVDGTGAYEGLSGRGSGIGGASPLAPWDVRDRYLGRVGLS